MSTPLKIRLADFSEPNGKDGQVALNLLATYALHPLGGGEALPLYAKENYAKEFAKRDILRAFLAFELNEDGIEGEAIGLCNTVEGESKPVLQAFLLIFFNYSSYVLYHSSS